MAGTAGAKRKAKEAKQHSRPVKKFKKQKYYSSGSETEDDIGQDKTAAPEAKVSQKRDRRKIPPKSDDQKLLSPEGDSLLGDDQDKDDQIQDDEQDLDAATDSQEDSDDAESDVESVAESSDTSQPDHRKITKRRDPNAFASSISAILSSKLTTSNRKDPVLARSKTAATASHELAEAKLEAKAKRRLRDEKRELNEKGRVRNVLLGDRRRTPGLSESEAEGGALSETGQDASAKSKGTSAGDIAEQERRLKKTAQRGVVKLFNAVRQAQVRAEEASKSSKTKGIIGVQRREEKIGEMGRQAFLDLVGKGKVEVS